MNVDIETLLLDVKAYLQANLNTAITDLNTEKNDGVTLDPIADEAYFIQTLNQAVANYDPYLILGVTDIQSEDDTYSGKVKKLVFQCAIVVADTLDQDLQIGVRMLRYLRILEDLFNKGFNKIRVSSYFKVNSLVPIALTALDTNDRYRAVGVEIVTQLG